ALIAERSGAAHRPVLLRAPLQRRGGDAEKRQQQQREGEAARHGFDSLRWVLVEPKRELLASGRRGREAGERLHWRAKRSEGRLVRVPPLFVSQPPPCTARLCMPDTPLCETLRQV